MDKKQNRARKKIQMDSEQKYSFELTKKNLIDGVILSEILGKPKAKKGLVSHNVYKSINSR